LVVHAGVRHPHLQAEPVWKTHSLLNSHTLSHVKVMLECDVAVCRLGREVTMWPPAWNVQRLSSLLLASVLQSRQAGRSSNLLSLLGADGRKRFIDGSGRVCFRFQRLGHWATDEICPKFGKGDEEENEWDLAMNYCRFVMIFICCVWLE
jgi:hypothetical protein